MPCFHNSEQVSILFAVKFFPKDETRIYVSVALISPFSSAFSSKILKIRSIPIDPPTEGIYFPENIPINPSYLPPPEIEPTRFVSVKIAS